MDFTASNGPHYLDLLTDTGSRNGDGVQKMLININNGQLLV